MLGFGLRTANFCYLSSQAVVWSYILAGLATLALHVCNYNSVLAALLSFVNIQLS